MKRYWGLVGLSLRYTSTHLMSRATGSRHYFLCQEGVSDISPNLCMNDGVFQLETRFLFIYLFTNDRYYSSKHYTIIYFYWNIMWLINYYYFLISKTVLSTKVTQFVIFKYYVLPTVIWTLSTSWLTISTANGKERPAITLPYTRLLLTLSGENNCLSTTQRICGWNLEHLRKNSLLVRHI